MSDTVIKVKNLSKQYRIGSAVDRHQTFREAMTDTFTYPFRRLRHAFNKENATSDKNPEYIWALKDVSFEVKQGEVVGIIGRNGAGKSTLLKILARITEPTEGRATLRGRVGSLLEVGTGFHSELTGEENIYLSGTILGMSSSEISRKFDEIVAFAEMEKFINTPVKYYSSGMYMRLAFAVAAHLEPEILLVDEVLAVGDAEFQKKCLGKMGDVAKEGRTVLFVSHNMGAVQALCKAALQLDMGRIVQTGDSISVVSRYLDSAGNMTPWMTWNDDSAPGSEEVKLKSIRAYMRDENESGIYRSREDIYVEIKFMAFKVHSSLCIGFDLLNSQGNTILRSFQTDMPPHKWPQVKFGENIWRCTIPGGLLNGGIYYLCPRIGLYNLNWIVYLDSVIQFEVILDHGVSPLWSNLDSRNRPGSIAPILKWDTIR